jgi:L-glyceraldehyde 3-phosphate reductase
MFWRWAEDSLLDVLENNGIACIAFSPLAQGLLTNKYLNGIPSDSRAAKTTGHLQSSEVTAERIETLKKLNVIAENRNQSLAQMAIAWLLKDKRVTSVLVGASSINQLVDNLKSLDNVVFKDDELFSIESI